MRRLPALALAVAAPILAACTGTPSPLTPSIHGSIGVPHQGMITNAVPLPKRGEGYALLRGNNGRNYGNPRLVAAIESAARTVARLRPGGGKLMIGDLSTRWGGEASGHHSHRTGRDADLLIFVETPEGHPVDSPGFVRFGPDGLGAVTKGKYVRVDLEREWQLIKALVSSKEANVQWLFFARWLEAQVIEYARARGEDPELVWYAESVLLQPGDSTAHDDHLHLRIACTPDEAVAGCLGGGPYWPWLPALPQLSPPPDVELTRALVGDLLVPTIGDPERVPQPPPSR
jgi:penicillin-insensitive murein DD-endopeptidase